MDTPSLQQQLAAFIQSALEQHQFARPQTPDTRVTGAYADEAAETLVCRLQASDWLLANAPGEWSYGQKFLEGELVQMLRSSLRFPLLMAKKPPRRRGEVEMVEYHRAVAEDVARHLLQGGWSTALAIVKKPPTMPHSTW